MYTLGVRSFPGFAQLPDYQKYAVELATAIGDPSKYVQDYWFTAGYNSPYQILNRHNEVWFVAK